MSRILLLILFLVPVVAFAYQGQLQNGTYISINNAFNVLAPEGYTIEDGVIGGHTIAVNFVNNYSEIGLYSIEWTPYLSRAADEINRNFDEKIQKYIPYYVANNLSNAHGSMKLISNKKTQINGKKAYQVIATGIIDNKPVVWIITMINFRSALGVAYLVQLYDPNKPAIAQIHWPNYNRFLNSLKIKKSGK